MRSIRFALVAAILLIPAGTRAAGFRPWVGASGSWATYSMSDVNRDIGDINTQLAGSGITMDEINNGFGFGATLGGDFVGSWSIGVGYDRLFANSEVGDATGTLTYDFPANAWRAFGEYRFPSSTQVSPRIGVAGGLVSESGSIELSAPGFGTLTGDLEGSGPLFETYAAGDWWAAPQFAVTGSLGYRYAKIGEVKIQGQTVQNVDGSKYTIDYGGFNARLGLKVAFTP